MTQTATSLRWKRRKEARPSELLDAALAVFAEKGFAAARLEDIASRAGVSKGTIYLYYKSKEEILRALIKAIPLAMVERVSQSALGEGGTPEEMLRRVLQMIGAAIRDPRLIQFPRLIIGEGGNFPWIAQVYREEVISRGMGVLSGIIRGGVAQGVFRAVDPNHAAYGAMSPLLFVAIWRTTFERFDATPFDAQAFIDQHIDTFVRGIKRGGAS
jgi:AcrR family transcriptional regulator